MSHDPFSLVAAVASYGLVTSQFVSPQVPLTDEWVQFLGEAQRQRMVPLLARAIETGSFQATPAQRREVESACLSARGVALVLERMLLHVVDLLNQAGIDYRVLKGLALARTIYPHPSLRLCGDVDVLVQADRLDQTIELLHAAGYVRRVPQLRPGFDSRFGKGVSLAAPSGFELDVHRTLAPGPLGLRVDLRSLFTRPAQYELSGRKIKTLPLEEHLVHACYHCVLRRGRPPLGTLRDIAQMLEAPSLDVEHALYLAQKWGSQGVVALGLLLASRVLALPLDTPAVSWASAYRVRSDELRVIRSYSRTSYAAQALASLPAIPGVLPKAAFLSALLWPDRQHLREKEGGRLRSWVRASARLLRGE